jgi:hypothetical protein
VARSRGHGNAGHRLSFPASRNRLTGLTGPASRTPRRVAPAKLAHPGEQPEPVSGRVRDPAAGHSRRQGSRLSGHPERNRRGNNADPNDHPEAPRLSAMGFDRYPSGDIRDVARATFQSAAWRCTGAPPRSASQSGAKVCLTRFGGNESRSRIRQMRRLRTDDPILLSRGAGRPPGGRLPPSERLQSHDQLPNGTGAAVCSNGIGETTYWARLHRSLPWVARPASLHWT